MKTLSAGLTTHIGQEVTTLATCWKVTWKNGTILGFTDHVEDLIISAQLYQAALGYSPTAVQTRAGLEVDNLSVLGVLDRSVIQPSDVHAGKWDLAQVEIFQVNYLDLSQGTIPLRRGTLGEVTLRTSGWEAELRGMMQSLTQQLGRLVTPACDADLGDARCKINLGVITDGTVNGSVTAVASRLQFTDSGLAQAADWFGNGKVTFTSGPNNGVAREVKTHAAGGVLTVQEPFPFTISVGEFFTALAGCDKLYATCGNKFANKINFRGFPHLPGVDRLVNGS